MRAFVMMFQLAVVAGMGWMGWTMFHGSSSLASFNGLVCQGNQAVTVESTAYDPQTMAYVTYKVERRCGPDANAGKSALAQVSGSPALQAAVSDRSPLTP